MDTYLMMLYVSLDQERAMKKLFLDNGWKYLKPDMLQLTSQLGGMVAKSMSEDSNNCKNTRVTSPAGHKVTRVKTVPSRPATRSQKARSHKSKILNVPPVRDTRSKMKSTGDTKTVTSSTEQNFTLTKDKPGELVDDDDLKDYMEYGDEDDDYDDDNENKEVKKKSRRLTRNSDGDEDMIDEDIIAKLDGTEDIVPKNEQANICVMEDDTVNSSDNDSDSTDAVKNEGFSSDLLVSESEAGINGPGKAESTDWFKRKKYQSDAWCLEKRQGKLSVQSLKHAKPIRIKVETDKVDESQNVYGCDDCGKVYSQRSSWKRHLKSHQPGVQNCGPCSMYFDTAELLELHNRRSHSSSFSCTVCGVSMIRKSCLRKHMLKVHPEKCIAKFSCPRSPCKAVFDSEELYEDHLNIHDGKRPYSCPMCNKTFASRSSLKLHKNCHSSARFAQCKDCGKTFQSQGALHNHKVSVHQKKRFKCEKCDKVFIYRSGYCKHLLSHKKEKTGSKSQTAPVVGDLKCNDVKVENVADSKASHGPVEFLPSGSCTKTTGQNQENSCKPNQMESESSLVESTNQVEPTAGEITPVGVPSLQTSVITGQDITGLPLTTLQIDGQVMWLYQT